ncbi:MAG: Unknown protein [uncultured Sulfurovum sp.]|uniref:Uncharacterized protein n=1 Tax=uncultured Sulfurovum sp. TaxID=269237 RepID=A0A6S6TK32_9BACT|nr:MAG: Unknown protein [uncultured Sulfurovum sp.]
MKNLFIYTLFSLFILGCGSDGAKGNRVMTINEEYTVSKGEQIVKNSEDALLKVIHEDKSEQSTVILLEGNATILPQT